MIYIRKVEKDEKDVINNVVTIHIATFRFFFLTSLGQGFLRMMYRSYCDHIHSDLLVAVDSEQIVGFLAYSSSMRGLYMHMIKKRLIPFLWYAFAALIRRPKNFIGLVRVFEKLDESNRKEAYVRLSSIGVLPNVKSSGIGSQLVASLQSIIDFSKYAYITLETDALDNEGANHFYMKNGFVLERTYTTREGREMNEYRYRNAVITE